MTTITHQGDDQIVPFVRRHGVAMLLAAAALAFLLPFGTVSCDNQTVRFTGTSSHPATSSPPPVTSTTGAKGSPATSRPTEARTR